VLVRALHTRDELDAWLEEHPEVSGVVVHPLYLDVDWTRSG
jgi:hypothetical protein